MPLFFCISGFFFSCPQNYSDYLRKKWKRIAAPYLVFNLLDMLLRSTLSFLFHRPRNVMESLLSILFHGGEFWFLYVLFFIYALFPPLAALQKKRMRWKITVETAFLFCAASPIGDFWLFNLGNLRTYLFFFNTGFLLRNLYPLIYERVKEASRLKIAVLSSVLLALWITLLSSPLHTQYKYVVSVSLALIGIATIYPLVFWKTFHNAFVRFGPWTLQLYLLNGWTLGISRSIICNIMGVRNPAVIIVFNMLVDFGLSYVVIKYFLARFRVARYVMGVTES